MARIAPPPQTPMEGTDTPQRWMALEMPAAGRPLQQVWRDRWPAPSAGQLRIEVAACGVCRTDLHVVDGELPFPGHPVVPGHEIVGRVAAVGGEVSGWSPGDRAGVPWLGWTCGVCEFCARGEENLCPHARFTGWHLPGGYAQQVVVDARFALHLPPGYPAVKAAPLLCAGLIGYRAYAMAGRDVLNLGLFGFGAAAHLVAQVAHHEGRRVFAFTRPLDFTAQRLARELGAVWAGGSDVPAPQALDAALVFAPVGALVPEALRAVRPGGTVVCAGIHMSDIPSFPYALLWGERHLRSVAHLTPRDGEAFMQLAAAIPLRVHTRTYALPQAPQALEDLRAGRFAGAAVLDCAVG